MITTIIFFLILYFAKNYSFSNDATLIFLGLFMLSLANEFKK